MVAPDGRSTGRQAVLYAAALLPVSLLPSWVGLAGTTYFVGAAVLGLLFLGASILFSRQTDDLTARRLLLASVIYLPAVLATMVIDRLF